MTAQADFFDIVTHAVQELHAEIERVTALHTVILFSTQHKQHLMWHIRWLKFNGLRDNAVSIASFAPDSGRIEKVCRSLLEDEFSDINKMSFLAVFSIVEACLEDAFSALINQEGAKELLIGNGVLAEKWATKNICNSKIYDTARKSSGYSYSEFHVKLVESFGSKLPFHERWGSSVDEMKEMRNCFLHRSNKVDDKLAKVGSRWNGKVGQEIIIDSSLFKILTGDLVVFLKSLIFGLADDRSKKILSSQGFLEFK